MIRITESNAWKSEFVYDGKMRCRIEKDYTWQSGGWVQTNEVRLVYDGNVPIQHRDINNLAMLTLTRGRDLSGSFQGAGGIGGILAMTENPSTLHSQPSTPRHDYFHCDGNGNVTMLIGTNQITSAKYAYDPFGNTLSIGPKALANRYRFSSKPVHEVSGLVYYLYRFYDPNLQRWPSRDPIAETGDINLYRFVRNSAIAYFDTFGQELGGSPEGAAWAEGNPIDCGLKIKNEVWKEYGPKGPKENPNDPEFYIGHCIAHCRITRECGGGAATSYIGGLAKEIQDFLKSKLGGGGPGFDPKDMEANKKGRACAKNKDRTCEEQCKE